MPTYKDIQQLTGLSLATISKYFNGGTVLEKNRAAIDEAATSLGFLVNGFARGLRSRKSLTVGVLLPSLDNEFHLTIIAAIEESLRQERIAIIVCSSHPEPGAAVHFLRSKMVDGIIAVPSPPDVPALQQAVQASVPVVAIDWTCDELDVDAVTLDNVEAGRRAARFLIDHGHRKIALLGGQPHISTMRERQEGFVAALFDAGIHVERELILEVPLTVGDGRDGMTELLRLAVRPTAVFCCNNELTIGAITVINESGLRMPEDISVLGFDNLNLAKAMRPPLTLITQPTHAIASEAAATMRQRLRRAVEDVNMTPKRNKVTLRGDLFIGGSVATHHDRTQSC